jgi:AraC-like DNA-binding protein
MSGARPGQVADTAPGRTQQPVRFTGYEPVSPQAARQWQDTYAYIRDTVLAVPAAAEQPLLAGTAAQVLVAVTLSTFPSNALTDPSIEERYDARPDTLRRAVAFIDEHAHEGITVADTAAAASVTIRAVQLAFRRHLDSTPTACLRRVRLDHAHRDLAAADPARTTVTAVAYRWGGGGRCWPAAPGKRGRGGGSRRDRQQPAVPALPWTRSPAWPGLSPPMPSDGSR